MHNKKRVNSTKVEKISQRVKLSVVSILLIDQIFSVLSAVTRQSTVNMERSNLHFLLLWMQDSRSSLSNSAPTAAHKQLCVRRSSELVTKHYIVKFTIPDCRTVTSSVDSCIRRFVFNFGIWLVRDGPPSAKEASIVEARKSGTNFYRIGNDSTALDRNFNNSEGCESSNCLMNIHNI